MRFSKNKKLSLLVLICFFIFFMGQKAKEEKEIPVVTADTGFRNIYDVKIIDETLETSFASDPVLKFHVPPSPKSYTLLFKLWITFVYEWSSHEERHAECNIYLRPVSDVIPYSMEVWTAVNIPDRSLKEKLLNSKTEGKRVEYFTEMIMRRDGAASWSVNHKSGEKVQDWKVTRIFSALIDEGFDVEVWVEGVVQGMKVASYWNVAMEVFRLSH